MRKIIFWQVVEVSTKGFPKKEKTGKIVALGSSEQKRFYAKMAFFRKIGIGKQYFSSEGKRTRITLTLSVLRNGTFSVTIQNHQTLQKLGFSRHKGKLKMVLLVSKCHLGTGPRKGVLCICDTQELCSAEDTIL